MKKFYQLAIVAIAVLTLVACENKTENNAEGNDSTAVEQTDANAPAVAKGTKGPCTIESEGFSVEIGDGWEVINTKENEVVVGVPGKEQLSFQYDGAANYEQTRQIMMNIDGMQDLGEKKFGENTYATYLWKQSTGTDFNAIMKIGDGTEKVIKVNGSNIDSPDNEVVQTILASVKIKE